jgi:glycosyltransferase involved in cell wall biosynthesis
MRVLHYKPTMKAEEGGVVKAVFDMCVLTSSEEIEVGLVTYNTELVRENIPHPAANHIYLHGVNLPHASTRLLSRKDLIELSRTIGMYDVVHLHTMWTPSNSQVIRLCRKLGKPYLLTVHGMLDDWCMAQRRIKKCIYLKTWGKKLLQEACIVHCTADSELSQASRWFPMEKGVSIPLPLNTEPYRDLPGPGLAWKAMPNIDRNRPVILFVSRLHPKKGLERLIDASALLHQRSVNHQLVIAGTGDERYESILKRRADSKDIKEHTMFVGFVAGRTKISLYQTAEVLVVPTEQENFGFVFFESLAAGTPVVTTRGADTWPEILASGAGDIVDATPHAIADAIEKILIDPKAARQRGSEGREWTLQYCNPSRVRQEYERLYRRCLEAKP